MCPDSTQDPLLNLRLPLGVPMTRLLKAEGAFLDMVREVARTVAGDVTWIVEDVREGSIRLLVRPKPASKTVSWAAMPTVVAAVSEGIAQLQNSSERPEHFTDRALEKARELADLVSDEFPTVGIQNGQTEVILTKQLVAHVDSILGRGSRAFGVVEGILESINVHDKRTFAVYGRLSDIRIECSFGHRIPVDEIANGVERRVAIYGEIRYRENGEIVSVAAEELEIILPSSQLPSADDVLGILAD